MISLCSLCVAVNCPVSFLTSYTYPYLLQGVGGQGTFWLYSAVSLLGMFISHLPLPHAGGGGPGYLLAILSSLPTRYVHITPTPTSCRGWGARAGLGTAFFYVLNALFFCVLLKHATFFCILFSIFWQLMKPKRTMRSFAFFSEEHKRTQRAQHYFAKNVKECKEHNILLQRT